MKRLLFTVGILLQVFIAFTQHPDSIPYALGLLDLHFDQSEVDSMRTDIWEQRDFYTHMRSSEIPNEVPPGLVFIPPVNSERIENQQDQIQWNLDNEVLLPDDRTSIAFLPVYKLASLIRSKKISSVELTRIFLDRLHAFGDTLECVITITDSLALEQARKADEELANGLYRGPLHGIPYGAKDLLAVVGYKTTWGAMPYKDQVLDYNATVIDKLEQAGAVLVAKLTLGALAWGDVWYGGKTRNPWDLSEGSSGSSAGSASATVAGLVPFAIGSETWGSIVSPATRCGATGLRPTFGRVSRQGAMALSWSMDKLGPICRNAIDCALVFDAIRGSDGRDLSVVDVPFNYNYTSGADDLRVGILTNAFHSEMSSFKNDSLTLDLLTSKGITLIEKRWDTDIPVDALQVILSAEAAAAFDGLTRSGRDSLLVRQIRRAWPNVFRAARFIPAVEYLQANRLRTLLVQQMNTLMRDIDVLLAPSFSDQLLLTNLTGHPCVVVPNTSYANGDRGTITLIGNHFDEASILEFARYLQEITAFHGEHPTGFYR